MVWQTRVTAAEGRLIAVVTQPPLVLEPARPAPLDLMSIVGGQPTAARKVRLAQLADDCRAISRELAAVEPHAAACDALLAAAARHAENASVLRASPGEDV